LLPSGIGTGRIENSAGVTPAAAAPLAVAASLTSAGHRRVNARRLCLSRGDDPPRPADQPLTNGRRVSIVGFLRGLWRRRARRHPVVSSRGAPAVCDVHAQRMAAGSRTQTIPPQMSNPRMSGTASEYSGPAEPLSRSSLPTFRFPRSGAVTRRPPATRVASGRCDMAGRAGKNDR